MKQYGAKIIGYHIQVRLLKLTLLSKQKLGLLDEIIYSGFGAEKRTNWASTILSQQETLKDHWGRVAS